MALLLPLLVTFLLVAPITSHYYLDFGQICERDGDCLYACERRYTNCDKGMCGCARGDSQSGGACYTPSLLGQPCLSSTHCDTDSRSTYCNPEIGLCSCIDSEKVAIIKKFCVGKNKLSPTSQCTTRDTYYYIGEGDEKGSGTYTSLTDGECGCPSRMKHDAANRDRCIPNKIGDSCTTIDDCSGSPTVICGTGSTCACFNSSFQVDPATQNLACILNEDAVKYGSLEEDDICQIGGDDTSKLCAIELECGPCPGNLANEFTCNTPASSSVPVQSILAVVLLTLTSSLMSTWMT